MGKASKQEANKKKRSLKMARRINALDLEIKAYADMKTDPKCQQWLPAINEAAFHVERARRSLWGAVQ